MQLPNQLLVELLQLILVGFEGLPEGDKRRQSLVDQLVSRGVRNLDEECDRHDIESVLLVQVAEALHDHQQVVLLSQQLMVLEVVHHLQAELVLHRRSMLLFLALLERFLAHGSLLAHARVCVT